MKKIAFNCPSCTAQHEVSLKNISGGMIEALIRLCKLYNANPGQWVDVKSHGISENDCRKLALWALVHTAPPTGRKKTSGLWMPTQQGWNFASNQLPIPKTAFTIQDQVVGYDAGAALVKDCIKPEKFDQLWA